MRIKRIIPLLLLLGLLLAAMVYGQEIEPLPGNSNPGANISFPPPVYSIRGGTPIRGTVNLPDMRNYYLEYRPLLPGSSQAEDTRPWFPISLPATNPITNNVIAIWNTRTVSDGLYEIRLTVNVTNADPQYFRVAPVRVENDINVYGQFLIPPLSDSLLPTAVPITVMTEEPGPTPTDLVLETTPTPVPGARVIARVDTNVRRGDDVSTPFVGALFAGESASILGISSRGTGWYYIELPNGRRGFVSPGIVDTADVPDDLMLINPPLPNTPTPSPTPIQEGPNLHYIRFDLNPDPPQCDEPFEIIIGVENNGVEPTAAAELLVYDFHLTSETETVSVLRDIPALQPGDSTEITVEFTIDTFFNEEHEIWLEIDPAENIEEATRADNIATQRYILRRAECLVEDEDVDK